MLLVVLTLILILIGLAAYLVGAIKLAKYGFRLGTGVGLAIILFPPYTFYFAFKQLEVDGKELPTAMCCFGLVLVVALTAMFWQPLALTFTGQFDEVDEMMSVEVAPEEMTYSEVVEAVAAGDEDALEDADEDDIRRAEAAEELAAEEEAEDEDEDEEETDDEDEDEDEDEEETDDEDEEEE